MKDDSITVAEAVIMLYSGRSNVIKAAKAADVEPDVLKRLLEEYIAGNKSLAPIQLTLDIR
jgi:hypothetical protein